MGGQFSTFNHDTKSSVFTKLLCLLRPQAFHLSETCHFIILKVAVILSELSQKEKQIVNINSYM